MFVKRSNYIRTLQISFIIVLLALVVLFRLFPRFNRISYTLPAIQIEELKILEIPRTVQLKKASPPPLKPAIPVAGEELEMLEEVPIESSEHLTAKGQVLMGDAPLSEDDLPFMPRQIIEVLPQVDDLQLKGSVVLKLLIDKNGRMKDYRVLSNSTQNPLAVRRVLAAARKSRWETISLNQNKVEYWITKTYQFK
ncbi:energy transducer TonB [Caldithrix abyssi]|uniref:TonB protein C-terminal n=1 Tax=Caldithrix abyssi DSM 13497 TaxID=880073 RepID=H1XXR0_CALAY|nr:energy transducer TonB [Caldithrix abyssi]APF19611.1 TonB protein C-terminal [Caldithrix abyssi DSM 13497]EHO39733.1 hypothetical protein Calab_0079 [Caldithrix abyssi DSM 13497]